MSISIQPKLRNSCLCFTLVEPEEVISRWYYKEKKKKKVWSLRQRIAFPDTVYFLLLEFFPTVVLNKTKSRMHKSLKFKYDTMEDVTWRWKNPVSVNTCEYLRLMESLVFI